MSKLWDFYWKSINYNILNSINFNHFLPFDPTGYCIFIAVPIKSWETFLTPLCILCLLGSYYYY